MSMKFMKRDKIKDLVQLEQLYDVQLNKEVELLMKIQPLNVIKIRQISQRTKSYVDSRKSKRSTNQFLGMKVKLKKIDLPTFNQQHLRCKVQTEPLKIASPKNIQHQQQKIEKIFSKKSKVQQKKPKISQKESKIQKKQSTIQYTLQDGQVKQQKIDAISQKQEFIQKKMNIGKKSQKQKMKNFILEMLNKGKSQSNCLIIQKGTAHCNPSHKRQDYTETKVIKKMQEQKYPLILVSNKRQMRSVNTKKIKIPSNNNNSIQKKTILHLPSINENKKYVQMIRNYEDHKTKKNPMHYQEDKDDNQKSEGLVQPLKKQIMKNNIQQIPEIIQQNPSILVNNEDENQIKQQILNQQPIK